MFRQERVERFGTFCTDYVPPGGEASRDDVFLTSHVAVLGFLFIGEKAAVLWDHDTLPFPEEALSYGFRRAGKILYDPASAMETIARHPDVFNGAPHDLQVLMEGLSDGRDERRDERLGLLLGFPKTSVLQFARRETRYTWAWSELLDTLQAEHPGELAHMSALTELNDPDAVCAWYARLLALYRRKIGIGDEDMPLVLSEVRMLMDARSVDIHGMTWVDPEPNEESDQRQRDLRIAYRESGLADIIEPLRHAAGIRPQREYVRLQLQGVVTGDASSVLR